MTSIATGKSKRESFDFDCCDEYYKVSFNAMASPCEFLILSDDRAMAYAIAEQGVAEVRRIECKFSRYQSDNICHVINHAQGARVKIDDECYRLLCFAQTCYELSEGMFDLTSGVLRRVWTFDCSDKIPSQKQIDDVLPFVGWPSVNFDREHLQMKSNMEIDFGGIGKEYAVSCVVEICKKLAPGTSVLVNLGGDIQISEVRMDGKPWSIGIESTKSFRDNCKVISISSGALATSGDSKRYLMKGAKRYSHILNPKTGWPVSSAPSSVTVVAPLCIQAGCIATLALLKGRYAEKFLKDQGVQYWCEY